MNKSTAAALPSNGPVSGKPAGVTPMMAQYIEIKAANPDCLLFYRMGDFYELFFDDAETASRALGITLTKRGKHLGADIPMCGVPVHSAQDYLLKLIASGFRVAVCEQTEDPAEARKRGSKAVVRREVKRLVTPGTLTEDTLLEEGRNNFLAAYCALGPRSGVTESAQTGGHDAREAVAWIDISTGEFRIGTVPPGGLATFLARIDPREILVPERLADEPAVRDAVAESRGAETVLAASFFDSVTAADRLCELFGVATMDSFGSFTRAELSAAAAIVSYVDKTQIAARPPISPPRRDRADKVMAIDPATRGNLEIFQTLSGARAGSLISTIDQTVTSAGRRCLARHLSAPLCDPDAINRRLDAVAHLHDDRDLRERVRETLRAAPDKMRAVSRLALGRGGPRDLGAVRDGLISAGRLAGQLADAGGSLPALLAESRIALAAMPDALETQLVAALADSLPISRAEGGFVRAGFRNDLDEARNLRDESRKVIAGLQARYAEKTGIKSLKIRHNNVLGYFVDVTALQADNLRAADTENLFIHRQTLANAVRFTTTELAEIEQKIAGAADRALGIELSVFDELSAAVIEATETIRAGADALAAIDVAGAHAEQAAQYNYVRPKVDNSLALDIAEGRHPVVEAALRQSAQPFVANDCALGPGGHPAQNGDSGAGTPAGGGTGHEPAVAESGADKGRIWLVTGPNMAGKSTFLRQVALIAVMAQSGAYVPAASAHIGVVDTLSSRVGAADDLARGRSTFMVEMVETAAILNQAGARALVILDEIGRGTATFDGLSIAWATIEHLHDANGCRALFATHYHELTALAAQLNRLDLATVRIKEWNGEVVFLHQVVAGAADRSYGIQVARLAGLPERVIERARQVLDELEAGDRRSPPDEIARDLPLFASSAKQHTGAPAVADPALAELDALDPDALSPRLALDALYALKAARRSGP